MNDIQIILITFFVVTLIGVLGAFGIKSSHEEKMKCLDKYPMTQCVVNIH